MLALVSLQWFFVEHNKKRNKKMKTTTFTKIILSILILNLSRLLQSFINLYVRRFVFVLVITGSTILPAGLSRAQTIYVDACAKGPGDGSAAHPYNTLTRAVKEAPVGSKIVILPGNYPETLRINKKLTITVSEDGPAVVGRQYYVGKKDDICVPVTVTDPNTQYYGDLPARNCGDDTPGVAAKVYYPSNEPGDAQIARGCPFPAVVYAHGYRDPNWRRCKWSDPLVGEIHEDYRQAEGILTRLATSGIIAISVDVSWGIPNLGAARGSIIIDTIAYLREQNQASGSWLEEAIDLTHVGLAGHSMGGAAVIYAAQNLNEEFFDELNLGVVGIQGLGLIAPGCPSLRCLDWGNPSVPMLVIHGTNEHGLQVGSQPLDLYSEASSPKHLVPVVGANHFGYTDSICLYPDDGRENRSRVGNVWGQDAQSRQQRTASNYLHAFFSYYLQYRSGMIDYLTQQTGQQCDHPGVNINCGESLRLFDDLESLKVEVGVCSCTEL